MNIKLRLVAIGLAGVIALTGCTAAGTTTSTTDTSTSTSTESTDTGTQGPPAGGPGGGVDASSVATVEELIALIQDAYGDAGLGLHRGHQPVQDVLTEVLTVSHDELHVRMDSGQNLSDIAEELGVGTDALVAALVASRSVAIDNLLAAGTITQSEADDYLTAFDEAFTFRVTWDGEEATPTFDGI